MEKLRLRQRAVPVSSASAQEAGQGPFTERRHEAIAGFLSDHCALAGHRASITCTDSRSSRKSNTSARAIGQAEAKTNNQAKSHERELGKFDETANAFGAAATAADA